MKNTSIYPVLLGIATFASVVVPPVSSYGGATADESDREKAAGVQMAFDVASIHLDESGKFTPPNFALDAGSGPIPPGGRFHADFPLAVYIGFAYKLWLTPDQIDRMQAHLPKWVATDHFLIDARSNGNPTKDQMRLMLRNLLADRFKLAVHFEMQESPVLAMKLVKPGELGPNLKPHSQGPPCDVQLHADGNDSQVTKPGVFPQICDSYQMTIGQDNSLLMGSRNTTMALMAASLVGPGRLTRPVIDETGLSGTYDFVLNFASQYNVENSTGISSTKDSTGPTFLEAIKNQLGIKLVSKKAPLRVLVVDHVELPSPN